jgi:hypothetical protein
MEKRNYILQARLNQFEKEKLEHYAKSKGISLAEAVRDWVKSLPSPKKT